LDLIAAQTQDYAASYRALGAPAERVHVTGSIKFDGVESNRNNPRTEALRRLLAIETNDLVWIAGSTQAPEEEIALAIYERLKHDHPRLRLMLVPRQRERFDEVARLLRRSGQPSVRRSAIADSSESAIRNPQSAIVLVDTIGELGALWGLADVAFVGGSLDGKRGGQNMIEPAAYGAAVVFGPQVWNFEDAASRLREGGAACQVRGGRELRAVVARLVGDDTERNGRGEAPKQFVLAQQGATVRTLDLLDDLLSRKVGDGRKHKTATDTAVSAPAA